MGAGGTASACKEAFKKLGLNVVVVNRSRSRDDNFKDCKFYDNWNEF